MSKAFARSRYAVAIALLFSTLLFAQYAQTKQSLISSEIQTVEECQILYVPNNYSIFHIRNFRKFWINRKEGIGPIIFH